MRAHKIIKSGLKPGDRVFMVDCYEAEKYAGRAWTVESEPWECCGSEIVLLEGKSGGFDTSRLKKLEDK
jgi:hypothetical protein